nr:hypothetical protein [Paenibacillus phytohabitans]
MKERCTKAAGNRKVVVSLERLRYQAGSGHPAKRGRLRPGRTPKDGTGKYIWTTE